MTTQVQYNRKHLHGESSLFIIWDKLDLFKDNKPSHIAAVLNNIFVILYMEICKRTNFILVLILLIYILY